MSTLFGRNGRSDSLVLEGRLAGGDCVAVTVTDGVISSIASAAATPSVLAPAFVDPHVHLRSPGREDARGGRGRLDRRDDALGHGDGDALAAGEPALEHDAVGAAVAADEHAHATAACSRRGLSAASRS